MKMLWTYCGPLDSLSERLVTSMTISDMTGDMLTRIRNAGKARKLRVDVLCNRLNRNVLDILSREGFLKSYKEVQEDGKTTFRVYLRYEDGDLKKPVIQGLRRVSTPGLRRYVEASKLPVVMSGFGMAIISTSKGVITDREARKSKVGGEHICSVW